MADADGTATGREQAAVVAGDPASNDDRAAPVIDRDLPTGDERLDAFISYARRPGDREFVDWLSNELTDRGKQVWLDRTSIEPAADWRARVARGIELANALIFVISPSSATSAECMAELSTATDNNKRIIPVVLGDVSPHDLPPSLTVPNWIEFRDPAERAAQLSRLLEALDADLEWRDASTRLAARAREWDTSGKDRSFLLRGTDLKAAETWYENKSAHQEQPTHLQDAYLAASRRGASRRLRLGLTAALSALVIAVALSVVALVQRNHAISNSRLALSGQYAAQSGAALSSDPARSLSLALSAVRTRQTTASADALRQAMAHFQLLRTLACASSPATAVTVSPDGSKFAVGTSTGIIQVWDARTLVKIWQVSQKFIKTGSPLGESIQTLQFSPSSTELLSASYDGTARLWDAWTGTQLGFLAPPGGNNGLSAAHFDASGALVVTTSTQGYIAVWDSKTGKRLASWHAPSGSHSAKANSGLTSAAFSPAGDSLLTAEGDGTVRVWQALTGHQVMMLKVPSVQEAIYSPDGSEIATTTQDGTVALWDASTGRLIRIVAKSTNGGWDHLSFLSHGRFLTASGGTTGTVETWLVSDGQELAGIEEPGGFLINDAVPSPSGEQIITVSDDGTARFWNPLPPQLLHLFVAGQQDFGYATFSPDGSAIATANSNGTASIFDFSSRTVATVHAEGHSGPAYRGAGNGLTHVAYNKDGTELLTGSLDGNVKVFNLRTGRRMFTYQNGMPVISTLFSPDGKEILFLLASHRAYIYGNGNHRISSFTVISSREDAANSAANVTDDIEFNRTGDEIVTAGLDGSIIVWKAHSGKRLVTFHEPGGQTPVTTAVFSPNGGRLLTASDDGTARIWSLRSHQQLLTVREPGGGRLSSAAFSPDGRTFVTASTDGTAAIWSAITGARLAIFALPGGPGLNDAEFNRAGTEVVTSSGNFLAVWSTRLALPLPALRTLASRQLRNSLGTAAEAPSLGH
jgi:WD40 repeat protein